jgi:hypothetical protein
MRQNDRFVMQTLGVLVLIYAMGYIYIYSQVGF